MSQEIIHAKGKLFELVHLPQDDGRIFEIARRAPGVRLIVHDDEVKKVLLTKEFRRELNDWDYRLPGGKVFDSLDEFELFRQSGQDVEEAAREKAIDEASEEAGIAIRGLELFRRSTLGATVEWDLYVYDVKDWSHSEEGQRLEDGEDIDAEGWFSYEEAERMVLSGQMQEERIALILLQWIYERKRSE